MERSLDCARDDRGGRALGMTRGRGARDDRGGVYTDVKVFAQLFGIYRIFFVSSQPKSINKPINYDEENDSNPDDGRHATGAATDVYLV